MRSAVRQVEKIVRTLLHEDVGDTIYQQLRTLSGAGGFGGLSRWGARDFVKGPNMLMFRVGRRGKVTITLDPGADTYGINLYKLGQLSSPPKLMAGTDYVFADQLVRAIDGWLSKFNP